MMESKEYLDLSVHEIKNILSAISGYSEFIFRGLADGPKALEMAGKIKLMSEILAAYADKKYMYDLLHDKLYKPEFESVSVYEELETVKNDVEMKTDNSVEIRIDCDHGLKLYVDRLLVRELFYGVMENASKYSREEQPVEIRVYEEGDETILFFRNESEEISQEDLEKLTEPYFRVDKAASRRMGGQGFGLAIVSEIMEIHGGELKIDCRDGAMTVELHFKNNKG